MRPQQSIVRRAQLPAIVGLSQATIDRLRARGAFVRARQLSDQAIGFLRSDIDEWLASRPVVQH
jgi:predicted DNA-binding transcriptional regulator AlpA